MSVTEKLHVTIGQVKIGRPGQSLHAILGSCIGIGFLFAERQVYGLAHCLLSKSDAVTDKLTGRHVDAALYSLTKMMDLTPADRRKIRVVLAGGANMTMPEGTDPKKLVGTINSTFATKAVREAGFRILDSDLGGMVGRQITINCDDGAYKIAEIPRMRGAT